ncbi:MAG: M23 family metallopeptidase [Comamonadaceae bacterium]|nr:M23 family metallopeptidase [Comamonadaceae bacterium]
MEPNVPAVQGQPAASADEIPDAFLPVNAPISLNSAWHGSIDRRDKISQGIDLAAPEGVDVLAPWSGKVVSTGYQAGYGNYILVEHPEGFRISLCHLGSTAVKPGDEIAAGEVWEQSETAGRSTGPHLHF